MPITATKTSWQNFPMLSPKRIEIALHFNKRQYFMLTKGFIPEKVEDKWFIFYEDDWLYFHDVNTGLGIYKAQLIEETNGYSIKEFLVERNQDKKMNENDKIDIENISFLIARGLLGIEASKILVNKQLKL